MARSRHASAFLFLLSIFVSQLVFADEIRSDRAAQREPLDVPRNWAVDFSSVIERNTAVTEGKIGVMALSTAPTHFIPVVPCRIVDSRRTPDGPFNGPIMAAGETRSFDLNDGPCAGIPANVGAYSLNLTVANPAANGFLTVWPTGESRPLTSNVNYRAGINQANAAIVPAGTNDSVDIFMLQEGHVIIDINGYLKPGVVTSANPGVGVELSAPTGDVTISIEDGGVTAAQLGASAVTTGAIQDGAVSAAKIGTNEVVKSIQGLRDFVDVVGTGATSVTATGSTITINSPAVAVPTGTIVLGPPSDTTLIGAGFTQVGSSGLQMWRPTSTTGALTRGYHTAVWTGTQMIVWGGTSFGAGSALNTGGVYDPLSDSWSATSTGTNVPAPRVFHTAVWTGSTMIVWGGESASFVRLDTGGIYTPASNSWAQTSTFGVPLGRRYHTAVWSQNTGTMIVWGGQTAAGFTNTGALYNPAGSGAWASTNLTGAPSARYRHSAIWTGAPQNRMIVWGGESPAYEATGAVYDPSPSGGGSWTAVQVTGAPPGRSFHAAVWTGTQMIVWGGASSSSGTEATGGRYTLASNSWALTSTTNVPSARHFDSTHENAAVWTGSRMIVWGGYPSTGTGGIYNPATDVWESSTTESSPTPRYAHTCVWTGTRLVVFGGYLNSFNYTNTGGWWNFLSYYIKN
jgi:hypothetical protein